MADEREVGVSGERTGRRAGDHARDARLALLADVGEQLSTSLDAEVSVGLLARLVVPRLADWCVVSLVDEDGRLRDVGRCHRDPALAGVLEEYAERRQEALTATSFVARCLRTGRTVVVPAPVERSVLSVLHDPRTRELVLALRPSSAAVVPLNAGERTLGLITLFGSDGRIVSDRDDLQVVEEVGARAGLALENARLYARQRRVAETLQRSLLTAPVEPDHLHVVTRYRPAESDVRVGGDWYDAFLTPEGMTFVVIGDVMGHDTGAAAGMGQLRTMVRTLACDRPDGPAGVLQRTDRVAHVVGLDTYATAVVARVDQDDEQRRRGVHRVTWSSAGHPQPVVLEPGVGARQLEAEADPLLGLDHEAERSQASVELPDGATLLLFTDGLVERRCRSVDDGVELLLRTMAGLAGAPLDELCDSVLERMLTSGAEDDVALVAVRPHRQDRARPAEAGPVSLPLGRD